MMALTDAASRAAPEPGMTRLRRAAEAAQRATGLRAEIIWGTLLLAPPRRGKDLAVVNALYDRLGAALPPGFESFQVISLPRPPDPDDYATPDVLVCDAALGESDDWLAAPSAVALTVEVVPHGSGAMIPREMTSWYAEAGVPAYLAVDPRDGTWTLHWALRDGAYRGVRHGLYGEDVELSGLGVTLGMGGLPRYGGA